VLKEQKVTKERKEFQDLLSGRVLRELKEFKE
jgi:hypothetical protein